MAILEDPSNSGDCSQSRSSHGALCVSLQLFVTMQVCAEQWTPLVNAQLKLAAPYCMSITNATKTANHSFAAMAHSNDIMQQLIRLVVDGMQVQVACVNEEPFHR